jgi:hypothetical protein
VFQIRCVLKHLKYLVKSKKVDMEWWSEELPQYGLLNFAL